jgi:hypothetical protein
MRPIATPQSRDNIDDARRQLSFRASWHIACTLAPSRSLDNPEESCPDRERSRKKHMKNRFQSWASLAVGVVLVSVVGCSDTADEVKDEVDCHQVCNRYADCFAPDYNVDACEDKCESDAETSEARQNKLRACEDCMDDKSCLGSFVCGDECGGIVP